MVTRFLPSILKKRRFSLGESRLLRIGESSWRHSMLARYDPPPYQDLQFESKTCPSYEEDEPEQLPKYSCTIQKSGYVTIKHEYISREVKPRTRSWRKHYVDLRGTLIRIYRSGLVDCKGTSPTYEFSMQNVLVRFATNYYKRRNVLRITFSDGQQFLFQLADKDACIAWIESLQAAANISLVLDDWKMPQFITLPPQRRRMLYGCYADMARHLQQTFANDSTQFIV